MYNYSNYPSNFTSRYLPKINKTYNNNTGAKMFYSIFILIAPNQNHQNVQEMNGLKKFLVDS